MLIDPLKELDEFTLTNLLEKIFKSIFLITLPTTDFVTAKPSLICFAKTFLNWIFMKNKLNFMFLTF